MRAALACLLLLIGLDTPAGAQLWSLDSTGDVRPEPWVLADGITDPVFATMLGVIDGACFGAIRQAQLDSIVTANGGSKLPYEVFSLMSRRPAVGGADSYVEIHLTEAVDRPIPYSLLGYNPGSIRASQSVELLHFAVGDRSYLVHLDGEDREIEIGDAHLFMIASGFMEMDFDGWLDRLLGSKLDDMEVKGFLTFRWKGQRYSLGMGLTRNGRGKTGAFDFVADETFFPAPKPLLVVGREMREEGLRRLERWRSSRAPAAAVAPRDPDGGP